MTGFRVFSPTNSNPIIINFPRSTTGIRLALKSQKYMIHALR